MPKKPNPKKVDNPNCIYSDPLPCVGSPTAACPSEVLLLTPIALATLPGGGVAGGVLEALLGGVGLADTDSKARRMSSGEEVTVTRGSWGPWGLGAGSSSSFRESGKNSI